MQQECVTDSYAWVRTLKSREVIRFLQADGWVPVRQAGSHIQFRYAAKPGTVTVPHPKSEMAIGTLKSIEKQSGLKLRSNPAV